MRFWTHWFDDAMGLQLNYSLGSAQHWSWMRYPLFAGHTRVTASLFFSLVLAVAGVLSAFSWRWAR